MFERASVHGQWSSGQAFFLAVTASAVGLANVWRLPYLVGEHGGGAFILIYLLCMLLIAAPIMVAEMLIGRRGRQSPTRSVRDLAYESGQSGAWRILGFCAILAGFLVLAYFSVVAGWILAYLGRAFAGTLVGISSTGAESVYQALLSDPEKGMGWHSLFMLVTMFLVGRGVRPGLENGAKLLLGLLVVLLLILAGFALLRGDMPAAFNFLFQTDFGALSRDSLLVAMGQAFFTLGLAVGSVMAFSAYAPGDTPVVRVTLAVLLFDTLIALLAGLAIFPLLFASGLSLAQGPALVFLNLPIAFGGMPGGQFFSILFFMVLSCAAWTSSIALMEPAVAWLVEKWEISRLRATLIIGITAWILGMLCLLSFGDWNFSFEFADRVRRNGFFDLLEVLTANLLLPLVGLAIALFAGWVLMRQTLEDELNSAGVVFKAWYYTLRYVTPVGMVLIFLQSVGVF